MVRMNIDNIEIFAASGRQSFTNMRERHTAGSCSSIQHSKSRINFLDFLIRALQEPHIIFPIRSVWSPGSVGLIPYFPVPEFCAVPENHFIDIISPGIKIFVSGHSPFDILPQNRENMDIFGFSQTLQTVEIVEIPLIALFFHPRPGKIGANPSNINFSHTFKLLRCTFFLIMTYMGTNTVRVSNGSCIS